MEHADLKMLAAFLENFGLKSWSTYFGENADTLAVLSMLEAKVKLNLNVFVF